MRALAGALLLCACAGEPVYTTRCGLAVESSNPDFAASRIGAIEAAAVGAGVVSCERIDGYRLVVNEAGDWDGLSGFADCTFRTVTISAWYPEVLLHELHHVDQGCQPPFPVDPGLDAQHADWRRSGAFERIEAAWNLLHPVVSPTHQENTP